MKEQQPPKITRRKAIEKTGKYAAATAAATFMILSPKQSQAASPTPPGWGNNSVKVKESTIDNHESKA